MIRSIIKKRKITLLFFTMILLIGFLSFFQLPKQDQPDVIINVATVTTVYPGASPEKIEQTVTKKIEGKVNEMQGIKKLTSTSRLGVSTIVVELKNGVDPKQAWDELRKKVKDAEADLPADAKQPIVNDDLNRSPIQTYHITADTQEHLYSLRESLKTWKDQLRTIPGVSEVKIAGIPDQEIRLDVDMQKLQQYRISWGQVMNAIKTENEKIPLGDFEIKNHTYQMNLSESYKPEELNQVIVTQTKEGFPVYVKDVGKVTLSTSKDNYITYQNDKPSATLSVISEVGNDVPSLQKGLDASRISFEKTLPKWAKIESVFSQNDRVNELFGDLSREMMIAVIAVLLVCTLGLNPTTSFMVALAIPISIATGLLFLPSLHITLNQMSIIALIIVLGILVDDAVVVNDNIERRLTVLKEGPFEAAVNGAKEVSISILTATLATIASFAPLMFLQGNAGEFIRPIPIIISLTMLASMIMSLTVIPIFRQWHEGRKRKGWDGERKPAGLLGKPIARLTCWYAQSLMPRMLKRPLLTGMSGVLIGLSAYFLIPFTPVQLFPKADLEEMIVNVNVPVGSGIGETDRVVKQTSDWLLKQPQVKMASSYVGGGSPVWGGEVSGLQAGQIVVKVDKRKVNKEEVIQQWNEQFKNMFPEASVIAKELSAGPPVGKPVVIRIYGEDIKTLRSLAQQVKNKVAKVPGTYNVEDNFGVEKYTLDFQVNQQQMKQKLVSYTDLSRTLRLVSEGITVSQFDTGNDLLDIKIYAQQPQEDPMLVFQRLSVPNGRGELIPLSELAEVKPSFSLQSIPHYNLSREVTISSDVRGRTATEVMKEVKPLVQEVAFPDGYRWEVDGETSEQTDIFIDMGKLSILVVFLIITLIAIQFYSLSLPLLVMSTVFIAFSGSLIGLFITRSPLGFMTMMGAISLSGIVVRNGIVLIEFIEEARRQGVPLKQAVIQAGEARLRPILLTSMTAVAGLMPLALSRDVLFQPLAVTIIFGLLFSTLLTLIVVPSLYTVMAIRKNKRLEKNGGEPPALQSAKAEVHM